ncbi:LacI family DNA-binding transcriptional regulator [Roseobacter sp. EG26]|uniref:LacI family DNA-binding transcriptional regulator n=1 Tax=Roseobacter sp. EG26 TaxID=3412477 RepID=UPI003CE5C80B
MRQPATIKDVAQHAGCGVASVSRVLNGSGPASAALRKRVLAAADELGFEFSEIGRSLQSSTTSTIGCVVPSLANPVYADAVQGAQETFQAQGYQTLLVCTSYNAELELNAIRTLMAKQVDGFVLTVSDALSSEGLKSIQRREVPHCLLFNMPPGNEESWSVDDRSAAKSVADAFHNAGHKHVGFLALKFKTSDRARQRYEGFVEGCAICKMQKPALLEINEDSQNLTELLQGFLTENPTLTGIFVSNDFLALATIRSARKLGLKVPSDLSIVGFDGIDVGTMVEPSLATIVTDPKMMGSGAAGTVLSIINGTSKPTQPDPEQSFSFRGGGSLAPPGAERTDDEKAATSSPSNNPTQKNAEIQPERST